MLPITSLRKPNSARKFTTSNLHTFAFLFSSPLATLSYCTSCVSFAPFDSYLSLFCMLFIPFEIPYLLLHPVCLGAEMAHNFTHSSSSNTFSSQPGNMHRKQQTSEGFQHLPRVSSNGEGVDQNDFLTLKSLSHHKLTLLSSQSTHLISSSIFISDFLFLVFDCPPFNTKRVLRAPCIIISNAGTH